MGAMKKFINMLCGYDVVGSRIDNYRITKVYRSEAKRQNNEAHNKKVGILSGIYTSVVEVALGMLTFGKGNILLKSLGVKVVPKSVAHATGAFVGGMLGM